MLDCFKILLDQNRTMLKNLHAAKKRVEKYSGKRLTCDSRNYGNYYRVIDIGANSPTPKYSGTIETPGIQSIISYNYLTRAIAQAETNIRYLQRAADNVKDIDPNRFRFTLPKAYQSIPDYIYKATGTPDVNAWLSKERTFSTSHPERKIFPTKAGWMVRSKSEGQIADRYYDAKVPFVYEELRKINGVIVAPDFTLLHPITYREIIHEHFGMMDDPEYFQKGFLYKLLLYISAGHVPGVDLIMTFETREQPLTTSTIDRIITHYFEA